MLQTIIEKFIFPIAVGIITYLLFKKHDEYIKRRDYSTLGVAVMESLLEEVNTGIDIMRQQQTNPLPVKSWDGVKTISDDVLLRIIAVSKGVEAVGFPPREIRIHCKNYFEHMSSNWEAAIRGGQSQLQALLSQGKYVEAAEAVRSMLMQRKEVLEANEKERFPK